MKTFNLGKVKMDSFPCIVDIHGKTKQSALSLAEKIFQNAGYLRCGGLEGIPENWVVNIYTNDCFPVGVHAQKFRRGNGVQGHWRVRLFLIEDWEDKIVIQHNRHFDVLEIKNA